DIITNKVKDTLYIAREAVRHDGDRTYAMIQIDEMPTEVPIEVGIQTPIHAEILSGLEPGQEVVVGDWEKALAEFEESGKKGSSLRKILWLIRSK
ncbi:MAG TPA: efflux transporter periplasmic adaptor subunit, partial [Nitrospina sp.]|nr:efflux transporter periplasmic adaptor subunit [Nitrospina sp.]